MGERLKDDLNEPQHKSQPREKKIQGGTLDGGRKREEGRRRERKKKREKEGRGTQVKQRWTRKGETDEREIQKEARRQERAGEEQAARGRGERSDGEGWRGKTRALKAG